MESGDLLSTVAARFIKCNHAWLQLIFDPIPACVTELLPESNSRDFGHVYKFTQGRFATRLGLMDAPREPLQGPKCGDNGGRTQKKEVCKRNGVLDGRCALHPWSTTVNSTEVYQAGEFFAEATLSFGVESHMRPLPFTTTFKNLQLIVRGKTLFAVDLLQQELTLTPAFIVWDTVIEDIKQVARIPRELQLAVGEQIYPAEPWWTIDMFCTTYNLSFSTLLCDNKPVKTGWLIKDYPGAWSLTNE
jgi:hypothetical protein